MFDKRNIVNFPKNLSTRPYRFVLYNLSIISTRDRHYSSAKFSSNKNFISINIKGNEKILSYKYVSCENWAFILVLKNIQPINFRINNYSNNYSKVYSTNKFSNNCLFEEQRARLLKNSFLLPNPNQNGMIFKRADPSHTAKWPVS